MKTKLYRDLFTSTIKETREEVFQRRQDFVPCQKVENVPSTWRQLHLGTSSLRPVCPALAALVCLHWLRMLTHSSDATAAATHVISLKEYYVFLPTSAWKGYPLQYSGLENSMDHIVHGVTKIQHDFHFHFTLRNMGKYHWKQRFTKHLSSNAWPSLIFSKFVLFLF